MTKLHCPTCGVEIDEHEAGDCLDAWAAEVVMGYEKLEVGYLDTDSETVRQKELEKWTEENHLWSVGEYWIDVDKNFWTGVFQYTPSKDIAAAWTLLEKMARTHTFTIGSGDGGVTVLAYPKDKEKYTNMSVSGNNAAPLAITRAAIKAVSR